MFEYEKHIHIHMNAYLMNIVIHFVVTYEAFCEYLYALYAIKCIPMVNPCGRSLKQILLS